MYYGKGDFTRGKFYQTMRAIEFKKSTWKIKGHMGSSHTLVKLLIQIFTPRGNHLKNSQSFVFSTPTWPPIMGCHKV